MFELEVVAAVTDVLPSLRNVRERRPRTLTHLVLPAAIASGLTLVVLDADYQVMAAPLLASINLGILCLAVLWRRDRRLPLFDAGTLCVAATVLYTVLPFLPFLVTGLTLTPLSDTRLLRYGFDLHAMAALAWRYVVYLGSFVAVYLAARRRTPPLPAISFSGDGGRRTLVAVMVLLAIYQGFRWAMFLAYDLNLDVPYTELYAATSVVSTIPYVLWQVTAAILTWWLVMKQALLLLLLRWWHVPGYRWLIVGWLGIEVVAVALRLGARTDAVLLLMSAALLYDRLVRPIRMGMLAVGAACLVAGFLAHGYVRGVAGSERIPNVRDALVANSEFQVLFGTAFDVLERKRRGELRSVPWQLYVSDFYLIIPSQILPFEKVDPAEWYLDVIGIKGGGVGLMFGGITQAVLGLDWIELVARGAVLALLFAALHRWYVPRAAGFWPTLLYLFIAIWSYYTIRATTFMFFRFVVFQFIPVTVAVKVIGWLLPAARDRRGHTAAPVA